MSLAFFGEFLEGQDRIPKMFSDIFLDITRRAKTLLAGCTDAQLRDQTFFLDLMVMDWDPTRFETVDENKTTPAKWYSLTALFFEKHTLYTLDNGKDLTWPQYFALLSLCFRDQAWLIESVSKEDNFPKKYRKRLPDTIAQTCS